MCCPDRKKCHPCHAGGQVIVGQVGLGWPGGTSSSLVSVTPLCQNKQTLATRGEGTPHDNYHNTARANSAQKKLIEWSCVCVFIYGGRWGAQTRSSGGEKNWRGKKKGQLRWQRLEVVGWSPCVAQSLLSSVRHVYIMRLTTVPPLLLQRHEARPKNSWLGLSTHRQVDHQAVCRSVVHRDRPLHLAAQVGDVHPLALQQLHPPRQPPKTRSYQVRLQDLGHFPRIIKSHCIAVLTPGRFHPDVRCDDGGVESAVHPRGHDPRAQDTSLCETLPRRHCDTSQVSWVWACPRFQADRHGHRLVWELAPMCSCSGLTPPTA